MAITGLTRDPECSFRCSDVSFPHGVVNIIQSDDYLLKRDDGGDVNPAVMGRLMV